ncbi:hypothetical protein [Tardiphaga sp.]|jgi:ATP-dependent DNA ligase|uniref:hypothetical protein n=1 Tax=Tardiphaga sp. TaxID=1926292 RepID=UPI0037D9BD6B
MNMTDDINFNKPSIWNGEALTGEWLVTIKVDGVRALWSDRRGWLSRAGRPLYHIPPWQAGARDCELYVNSFRETIVATRTKYPTADTPPIHQCHLYGLDPIDPRLHLGTLADPSAEAIRLKLARVQALGYEGLVLRQGKRWIKVKPSESHDVPVTGFVERRGKHTGMLGFITTPRGNVGSGFSDEERRDLWAEASAGTLVGQIAEIHCMELTSANRFRHPIFIRMRPDRAR